MLVINYSVESDVKWGMQGDALWLIWGEIRGKKESASELYGAKWVWPMEPGERDIKRRENNRLPIKEATFEKNTLWHTQNEKN